MRKLKLGIIGCGAIGEGVSIFLEKKLSEKIVISYLFDIKAEQAKELKDKLKKSNPKIVDSLDELIKKSDLVLESAEGKIVETIIKKAVCYKTDVIVLSIGGLIGKRQLLKEIEASNINVYLPSGAIVGIDGIIAASLSGIKKCVLTTSKPPKGLAVTSVDKSKKIPAIKKTILFEGSVSQAYKLFPKNINVAATLLFASRFSCIKVIIQVDPKIKTNIHQICLESKETKFNILVENRPSKKNPKTSALAIASTKALFYKLVSNLKVGT